MFFGGVVGVLLVCPKVHSQLITVPRMRNGGEEVEDAIEVGSETLSDPMVVRSSAHSGSRARTRAMHRWVESSFGTEMASWGTMVV